MSTENLQREFVEAAAHWLELFDEVFARESVPVHARPLKSAFWLVRDGITEIRGGTKDGFWEQEWFGALVTAIRNWYRDRYGVNAVKPQPDVLGAIVELHSTPVRLAIPTTVSRVEVEGETAWMIFPDRVHESEAISSFLPLKPNLNGLSARDRLEFDTQVADIVRLTRTVKLSLDSAALPEEAKQMSRSVWGHVEKAITDILTLDQAVVSVGCWDMHLAVEKAFKIFLAQNGTRKPIHSLEELAQDAARFGLVVTPAALERLPHWKVAVNHRYSESDINVHEAVELYRAGLQLVEEITSKLKRSWTLNNAGLLIKRAMWAD